MSDRFLELEIRWLRAMALSPDPEVCRPARRQLALVRRLRRLPPDQRAVIERTGGCR